MDVPATSGRVLLEQSQRALHELQDGQRRENGVIAQLFTALCLFAELWFVTLLVATAAAFPRCRQAVRGGWPGVHAYHQGAQAHTVLDLLPLPKHVLYGYYDPRHQRVATAIRK